MTRNEAIETAEAMRDACVAICGGPFPEGSGMDSVTCATLIGMMLALPAAPPPGEPPHDREFCEDIHGEPCACPPTPTPEAAARAEARAEVAALRGMMREAEEVLRGHMIGINCKGPRMDDDLAKRWRTALAHSHSEPHDAAKVGGDE